MTRRPAHGPGAVGTASRCAAAFAFALAATLCACSATPTPPTRWYELRADPPEPTAAPAATGPAAPVWEVGEVSLPGALSRDTLVVGRGTAGVEPLAGHRWVEPLRDRIPRLLRDDLAALRGPGSTWAAPAPPGVAVAQRLRVEIRVLQADAGRRTLRLAATWWQLGTGEPAAPPRAASADFTVAIEGTSVDALAAAHRLALWRLAQRIAAPAGAPGASGLQLGA